MFRATSRPLFRIGRAPCARCATQLSIPRIPASTRPILRVPTLRPYSTPPQPSFASTVDKRGWWQRAWFREDGTPRSKRKGAFYALVASLALVPIAVLKYALVLLTENVSTARLLARCYRIDRRYDQVDWDDFDSVLDYFRDLIIVLLVHHLKKPQDEVDMVFDRVKLWGKEDPVPSSESAPESRVLITKRIFTRAAYHVHLILHFRSVKTNINVGFELIELITLEDLDAFGVVRILLTAMVECMDLVEGELLLQIRTLRRRLERLEAASHVADWETVDK
ncbi:hypothetical protein BDZ89DRAFT_353318 [Hymenopellis radicata]|nr:hypothetical protein BDZ89DRAFT_353318 [Hymenopellis radicata]